MIENFADCAGLILAAGKGTRLRPLTQNIPKPLITVGGKALLDLAIDSLPIERGSIAVNVSYLASQIVEHVRASGVHVSLEVDALGSAGAVGLISEWVDGRDLMIRNADMWFASVPNELWRGWTRERPRLLVQDTAVSSDFETYRFLGWSLLPSRFVRELKPERSSLLEAVWRSAHEQGDLELIEFEGSAIDCGTPENLRLARTMVADGAT